MCKASNMYFISLYDTIPAWLDDPYLLFSSGKPDKVKASKVFGNVDYKKLHEMLNHHIKRHGFNCVFLALSKFSWNSRYRTSQEKLLKACCSDSDSTKVNTDSMALKIGLALLVVFVLLYLFKLIV